MRTAATKSKGTRTPRRSSKLEKETVRDILSCTVPLFLSGRQAWFKNTPSPYTEAGVPDITGVGVMDEKEGTFIAIEVKRESVKNPVKKLSDDQRNRLHEIFASGGAAFACSCAPRSEEWYSLESDDKFYECMYLNAWRYMGDTKWVYGYITRGLWMPSDLEFVEPAAARSAE